MHLTYIYILIIINISKPLSARNIEKFLRRSTSFIQDEEDKIAVGGTIELTKEEKAVNKFLMDLKHRELDDAFPYNFNLSKNYFSFRKDIYGSKVYQIIRRMPKGALLHIHSSFFLGPDYYVNLTYQFQENLYVCDLKGELKALYSTTMPSVPCKTEWALLSDLRKSSNNMVDFDKSLREHFTMDSDEALEYDSKTAWDKFHAVYRAMKAFLKYRPIREQYIKDALAYVYDDNVMYVEVRAGVGTLYDMNGTVYDGKFIVGLYERAAKEFKKTHPDFIGLKVIIADRRISDVKTLKSKMSWILQAKEEYPKSIIGYDLVGNEDYGHPLLKFRSFLFENRDKINYFFHAGETNWYGMPPDLNLIDAIALGTKRIGHGLSLVKHPVLMSLIRKKEIAIEANVVSNTVLGYVSDLRNHPLATYLALGLPVVVSSDDPGAWEADALSHDFYLAFMAVASRSADLRLLKALALNSIKYCALCPKDKAKLQCSFDRRWKQFLKEIQSETKPVSRKKVSKSKNKPKKKKTWQTI